MKRVLVFVTVAAVLVAGCDSGEKDPSAKRIEAPQTVFSIGSITKAFTAAAILDLAEEGKLSLSDRAGDLLPTLRGPVAGATVEQLLLHTSGLKGTHAQDHQPLSRDQAIAAIGALEQAFPPGRRFLYSNAGYTLLALIVERVSGTTCGGAGREQAGVAVARGCSTRRSPPPVPPATAASSCSDCARDLRAFAG